MKEWKVRKLVQIKHKTTEGGNHGLQLLWMWLWFAGIYFHAYFSCWSVSRFCVVLKTGLKGKHTREINCAVLVF